jgi:predicted Zn-dependent peptidase
MAVMVKGTTRRSGAELAEAVAGLGGKISAQGEVDYSEIRASSLARFWRELLSLTAELALQPRLAPEEVDRERDWLLSRVQRRLDNAPARAFDEFYSLLYQPHPYGLPTLGTPASLKRIDHAAIVARYREFFQPARMVLTISGQVRTDETLAEVQRLFGGLSPGGGGGEPSSPPPAPAGRRRVIEQEAQQTQILVGGLAPALDGADHAAVKVLSTILGGGMAGRLFVELRDRRALAYTATAFYEPVKEPGALVLYLGTTPESAAQAEQALLAEVARVQREPVSDDELRRAKRFLLGRYAMDRRTNERQAWYLAFYEVERTGIDYPDRYRRAVEAVTAADVRRVARAYLGTLTTVVLGPRPPR